MSFWMTVLAVIIGGLLSGIVFAVIAGLFGGVTMLASGAAAR